MRVQLISHASVIIETADRRIWTDPWLLGKAFNDSWSLYPQPAWEPALVDEIDFLWISHEHPDHFNIPTLRSLPKAFKERVTVLFQRNNSQKMFDAFGKLGFPNHRELPHRERVTLSDETAVYCYQVNNMDSCLGVESGGKRLLNVNDAIPSQADCKRMRSDFGTPDLVLNQFAIAGYGGFADREQHLPRLAKELLDLMVENHRDLGAGATLPFASFILFSSEDNRYINAYKTTPDDVVEAFAAADAELVVLYPGDAHEIGSAHDNASALERFRTARAGEADFAYDPVETVALPEIESAFRALAERVHQRYPKLLLARLRPVVVAIPDLDARVRFGIADGSWRAAEPGEATDLEICSQPLHFAFSTPFGFQTLGVSARFTLHGDARNQSNWQRHRILFAMNNAEVYLRPRLLFSGANLRHLWARRHGLLGQISARIALMGRGL